MCINSVKETCFSKKYQKWIYQVLEMSSSIVAGAIVAGVIAIWEQLSPHAEHLSLE